MADPELVSASREVVSISDCLRGTAEDHRAVGRSVIATVLWQTGRGAAAVQWGAVVTDRHAPPADLMASLLPQRFGLQADLLRLTNGGTLDDAEWTRAGGHDARDREDGEEVSRHPSGAIAIAARFAVDGYLTRLLLVPAGPDGYEVRTHEDIQSQLRVVS